MSTVEKILEYLRRGGYVSGQEISNHLNISRNGVSKWIKILREKGYEINSVTNKGYLLISEPDELSAEKIAGLLKTTYIGYPTKVMDCVDSTNEEVKRAARGGGQQGLLLVAKKQTGGKGRLGRVWISPEGTSIYMSVLLTPELSPTQLPCITLVFGLAICRAIRDIAECEALIKWPNDIIIGNKKLCGILAEMTVEDNLVSYATVGVGINVNNRGFSDEISHKATSLYLEKSISFDRNEIIAVLCGYIEQVYDEFIVSGFDSLKDEYVNLCATIGRDVSAQRAGGEICGKAVDVADDGSLIVELDSGDRVSISTGEVAVQGIY